jgi:hypothetical protein
MRSCVVSTNCLALVESSRLRKRQEARAHLDPQPPKPTLIAWHSRYGGNHILTRIPSCSAAYLGFERLGSRRLSTSVTPRGNSRVLSWDYNEVNRSG